MRKVLALVAVCVLAAGLPGCTEAPVPDRSKDFPLTVLDSAYVPGILQTTSVELAAPGHFFLVLKVRIENRGTGTAMPVASGFRVYIDNERYQRDFLKDTGNDPRFAGQDFGVLSIPPKSYAEGWMVFEVPMSTRSVNNGELRFYDRALVGEGAYSKTQFAPSSATRYENVSERMSVEARSMLVSYKYKDEDGTVHTPSERGLLFAAADLVVTNNARNRFHLSITADNIVFVSSDRTEYTRGTVDSSPDQLTPLKAQDIQPGGSARGTVIYELPEDDAHINKILVRYSAQETYSYSIPRARIEVEENGAPLAKITANDTGFIDTAFWFDGNDSTDPDGDALSILWNFGDRGAADDTSTEQRAFHKYAEPGTYTVSLKVTDIGGLESTVTKNIRVTHYFSLKERGHGIETDPATYHDGDFYVNVTLTNNAEKTWAIPSALFTVTTSEGAVFDWVGDDGNDPPSLPAGASATWRVYFEVPTGKVVVSITFDDSVTVLF